MFFNPYEKNFNTSDDIPYHIAEATRGGGFKTTLNAKILEMETGLAYNIKQVFTEKKGVKTITISGKKGAEELSSADILRFLESKFKFFFIEASNVNIPKLISEIINDEILPLSLDKRRSKNQMESLNKLEDFIDQSKIVVGKIENDLTKIFLSLLKDVDSLDTKDWKLRIKFPEYSYLREAISNMIDFTLFDTNERMLETKGSGIQRTVLLSLIHYVNSKTRKDVIWAIDEPEAFLQASLQKSLYNKLQEEALRNQIIITTHSQFFINVNNLENTFLFESKVDTQEYVRKNNKIYHKLDTIVFKGQNFEKAERIKSNFGLKRNDSWEIMPHNILVEGLEDKDYLIALMKIYSIPIPNILSAGGISKFSGYLQFINDYCDDLKFKPKVVALYDKDGAGKSEYNSLNSVKKKQKLNNISLENKFVINCHGEQPDNIEIEDLIPFNLVIDAANKIIRKRKFKIIKVKDRENKLLPVYKKKPILDFLNEIARYNNTDKPYELKFDSLEMKLLLSKNICKMLEEKPEYQEEVFNNIHIRTWLLNLTNAG